MRIQVVGDSPVVDELIGFLRLGGYVASKTDGIYSFHIDELKIPLCTVCRTVKSPIDYIIIDGVDCQLEQLATNYIQELGVPKIVLDRAGSNRSDRRLEIKTPNTFTEAVSLGLYRAIDKMLNKSSEPTPVVKKKSRFFGLVSSLLLAASTASAQNQNSIVRFWNPTLDAIVAAGDAANNALRVNMVAGTISGADGSILDGVAPSIKATVFDYTSSNPLAIVPVDANGAFLRIPSLQDNNVFVAGSYVAPVGFYTGSDSIDTGEVGIPRMSNTRVPYFTLAEASTGNLLGVITDGVNLNLAVTAIGRVADGGAVIGGPVRIGGKDGSGNTQDIITDTSGELQVDVLSVAGTVTTDPTDDDARVLGRTKIHDGTDTALVSGTGALNVTCDNCGGSTFADDDAFTGGTTPVSPIAALYDTTPPSITDGSAGIPRMNSNRQLLVDGSGVTQPVSGTFWQATQPVSAASLPLPSGAATSALQDGIIKDGTGDTTQANVSSGRLQVDGSGVTQPVSGTVTVTATNLDVQIGGSDSLTIGTFPDNEPFNLAQVAGATVATGNGTAAGSIRVSVASDSTGQIAVASLPNEGQQTAANSISVTPDTDNDAIGATGAAPPGEVVDVGGRTSGADTTGLMTALTICTDHVAVDIVTATTTLVVTGVANRHVRICAINLVSAGANNVALIAGTGATCGTSTAGINGGVTAAEGWNFAANGGISQGSGIGEIMSTKVSGGATGDSVCIITSAAVQLSGTISYAIY